MAGYWPSSFFACLWTETKSRSINTVKKNWVVVGVIARARPYSNVTKRCNLCITEKFYIICKPGAGTLNKRNELASACRHATKYLIKHA